MNISFADQLAVYRELQELRRLSVTLAPFADLRSTAKFEMTPRRALCGLLQGIERLLPGCPASAVLFRDPRLTEEEVVAWEAQLVAAISPPHALDPEEARVACGLFAGPAQKRTYHATHISPAGTDLPAFLCLVG